MRLRMEVSQHEDGFGISMLPGQDTDLVIHGVRQQKAEHSSLIQASAGLGKLAKHNPGGVTKSQHRSGGWQLAKPHVIHLLPGQDAAHVRPQPGNRSESYFGEDPVRQSLAVGAVLSGPSHRHLTKTAITGTEADAILGVLDFVDLALTGSLLPIVILSGYENFVSKIDHSTPTKHSWPPAGNRGAAGETRAGGAGSGLIGGPLPACRERVG